MLAAPSPSDPFAALNDEQRAAVFHGSHDDAPPLLIVAGAGSGKTLTLAARVARLVLQGADPQRLLLLSFSRRAAASLQRRAGLLLHQALGLRGTQAAPLLPWAGTFHSVAARLLREQAPRIGLHPDFTIADRADSEDLMGWLRQELGFAQTRQRFPLQRTCIAIHSRVINSPVRPWSTKAPPWTCRLPGMEGVWQPGPLTAWCESGACRPWIRLP